MKQPKLPRKRKKACIKADGRKKYRDTISLAYATGESPCKFWKNTSNQIEDHEGCPIVIPTASSYW